MGNQFQGHSWAPLLGVGKQYCERCGLVALKNGISQLCVRLGCNYKDHPSYQEWVKRGRKPMESEGS